MQREEGTSLLVSWAGGCIMGLAVDLGEHDGDGWRLRSCRWRCVPAPLSDHLSRSPSSWARWASTSSATASESPSAARVSSSDSRSSGLMSTAAGVPFLVTTTRVVRLDPHRSRNPDRQRHLLPCNGTTHRRAPMAPSGAGSEPARNLIGSWWRDPDRVRSPSPLSGRREAESRPLDGFVRHVPPPCGRPGSPGMAQAGC